jgi:hypothetical protein
MVAWDGEFDVVVVGSGCAALTAATAAVARGCSVAVLEKAPELGGTTARSGGAYWVPNNSLMRGHGLDDPRPAALKYMARLSYPALYDPGSPTLGLEQLAYDLIATFYDCGAPMVDELSASGALRSIMWPSLGLSTTPVSDPDYHAELPENEAPAGRLLMPAFEPGDLGKGLGHKLVSDLAAHLASSPAATIITSCGVGDVVTNRAGEVVGVLADRAGSATALRARKGVVFASGGFAQDRTKALAYLRGPVFGSGSAVTDTGDFVDIGIRLGASLGNMCNAFWYQVELDKALAGPVATTNADFFLPYGDSMLIVNRYGRRVANEKSMYHMRAQSHFVWDGTEHPNLLQVMIWDAPVAADPTPWPWRFGVPLPGTDASHIITGATFAELAGGVADRLRALSGRRGLTATVGPGMQLAPQFVDQLSQTVARFNAYATAGVDPDFRRGETPIEPAWQGPSRSTGNTTMHPLRSSGPYYALLLAPGTLDSCGGPVVNTSSQVLRTDGTPVPGLYGAGNCIASPAGQGYWSGGATISPAMVGGYLAGIHAAGEPHKEP